MPNYELKTIFNGGSWGEIERIYLYRGYILKYYQFCEEDCRHEFCYVIDMKGEELKEFHWNSCVEQAKQFVDELEDKK